MCLAAGEMDSSFFDALDDVVGSVIGGDTNVTDPDVGLRINTNIFVPLGEDDEDAIDPFAETGLGDHSQVQVQVQDHHGLGLAERLRQDNVAPLSVSVPVPVPATVLVRNPDGDPVLIPPRERSLFDTITLPISIPVPISIPNPNAREQQQQRESQQLQHSIMEQFPERIGFGEDFLPSGQEVQELEQTEVVEEEGQQLLSIGDAITDVNDKDNEVEFVGEEINVTRLGIGASSGDPNSSQQDFTTATFQCQFCHEFLVGLNNLNSHLRRVHRANVLITCNLCGKNFKQNRILVAHLQAHQRNQLNNNNTSNGPGKAKRMRRSKSKSEVTSTNRSRRKSGKNSRIKSQSKRQPQTNSKSSQLERQNSTKKKKFHPAREEFPEKMGTESRSRKRKQEEENPSNSISSIQGDKVQSETQAQCSLHVEEVPPPSKTLKVELPLMNYIEPLESFSDFNDNSESKFHSGDNDLYADLDFDLDMDNASVASPLPALSPPDFALSPVESPVSVLQEDPWGWDTDTPSQLPLTFTCSKCPLRFRSANFLRIHQSYHTLSIFVKLRCERNKCFTYFDDVSAYQRHFYNRHIRRRPKGTTLRFVCSRRVKTKIPCKYCNKLFRFAKEAKNHQETHFKSKSLGPKVHACSEPGCGMSFSLSTTLRMHMFQNHPSAISMEDGRPKQEPLQYIHLNSEDEEEPEPEETKDPLRSFEPDQIRARTRSRFCKLEPDLDVILLDNEELNPLRARLKEILVKKTDVDTEMDLGKEPISELSEAQNQSQGQQVNLECPKCSKELCNPSSLQRHIRLVHAEVKSFSCSRCVGKAFATENQLQQHLDYHKKTACHVCPTCNKGFKLKSHLVVHIRRHTNERPFPCLDPNCSQTFLTSSERRRHAKRHSKSKANSNLNINSIKDVNPIQHNCGQCDKVFMARRSLLRHIQASHTRHKGFRPEGNVENDNSNSNFTVDRGARTNADCYKCDLCPSSFSTLLGWARHKLKHDDNTDILCNHCGRQFTSTSNLALHKDQRHSKAEISEREKQDETHICEVCGKKLGSKSGLRTHMERHNGESCVCDECGKICITRGDLKFHKFTHLKEKPFQCSFCPYRYNHPSNIYHHMMRDHTCADGEGFVESELALRTSEKTFACEAEGCGEVFTSAQCLKQHTLYHKGARNSKCKKCPLTFICKYDVYVHSTRAHRDQDFKCEHCGKEFRGKVALECHVRYNHTGESPYTCTQCERKFKSNGDLSYHMVAAHTGDYRFSCEVCGKKVVTKGNLNAHMRVHTGVRLFRCEEPLCEASFKSPNILRKHLFKDHGKISKDLEVVNRKTKAQNGQVGLGGEGVTSSESAQEVGLTV